MALARRAKGESVPSIATLLGVGRSTLYRALEPYATDAATLDSETTPSARYTPASPAPAAGPHPS